MPHSRDPHPKTKKMGDVRHHCKISVLLLAVFISLSEGGEIEKRASVVLDSDGQTLLVKPGYNSSVAMVAWGIFRDEIHSSG